MFKFWTSTTRPRTRLGKVYRRSASVLSFNHDGLEIARVRHERRWLPLWHVAVFLYLALLIRLVAMADIGPAAYASRIDQMNDGSFVERAAARVMQMDPWSQKIAVEIRHSLKNLGMI